MKRTCVKKKVPLCEHCGKPATRRVDMSIDEHWLDLERDEWDGDIELEIRAMYHCDDCEVFVNRFSKKEIKRMAAHFCVDRKD